MRYVCSTSWSFVLTITLLLSLMTAQGSVLFAGSDTIVTGRVVDQDSQSIIGATITLSDKTGIIAGMPTDLDGAFRLKAPSSETASPILTVSAIGFEKRILSLHGSVYPHELIIKLTPKLVDIEAVTVSARREEEPSQVHLSREAIMTAGQTSLLPTNPINAITEPHVLREGSTHSSKIRISGTSPTYYLNGIKIGQDPNHYGMFSIVPSSIVESMSLYSHGTPVQFGLPTVVKMETPRYFKRDFSGEITASVVEITSAFSYGTDSYYMVGSLRKSLLDQLVKRLKLRTDRRTIPPTNFQDLFLTFGWRLNDKWDVYLDHYQVRDFLAYTTDAFSVEAAGIDTRQNSSEIYFGTRVTGALDNVLLTFHAAYSGSEEKYDALPEDIAEREQFMVSLDAGRHSLVGGVQADWKIKYVTVKSGIELTRCFDRSIDMEQINWNFLPPDYTSDNPNFYQVELNNLYGAYASSSSMLDAAGYVSFTTRLGPMEFEHGLRAESYSALAEMHAVLQRHRISLRIPSAGRIDAFVGTFAESPLGNVLEPYQVIIDDHGRHLKPMRSSLASLRWRYGPISIGAFYKSMRQIPLTGPAYSAVDKSGVAVDGFITAQSVGKASFHGADFSFVKDNFLESGVRLTTSYSYSSALKTTGLKSETVIPHDLDATHAIRFGTEYRLNAITRLGLDLSWRSGYPYTPANATAKSSTDRFNEVHYINYISRQNSAKFPAHATVNVHANFDFGRTDVFAAISNIANFENPIISTQNGYVFDAGIFPMIGMRWEF